MADYTPDELNNGTTSSVNLTAGSTNTFTFTTEAVNSYFTLETTRNSNGIYDSNSPTNLSGSIENLVNVPSIIHDDDYIAGFVLGEGTSSFDFIPSEEITGALFNLRTAGNIYLSLVGGGGANPDFIMDIDTLGTTSFNLRIGTTGAIPNTGTVYWGDGTSDLCSSFGGSGITHTYPSSGVYEVTIEGQFQGIRYVGAGDASKLVDIKQWGSSLFEFMNFSSTTNLSITATDIPNTTNITSFDSSFASSGVTTIPNINQWDWSNITSCLAMFKFHSIDTLDLSGIDLSSCTNFGTGATNGMFRNAIGTNINVSNWTLNSSSNITMAGMFRDTGTNKITGLSTWNIEKVTTFTSFLQNAKLSNSEYDALLIDWDSQDAVDSLTPNFGTSQYTLGGSAAAARANLISTDLWTITDGGGI